MFTSTFADRHIGPSSADLPAMLQAIGVESLEQLIEQTVPASIRLKEELKLSEPLSEAECLSHLLEIGAKNKVFRSYIGLGYYGTHTPTVIQRNVLENPGWYTAYTPYQAEIAQGRLEALINYQTMITDLTGMELANASLLDEGTASAEAMALMFAQRKGKAKKENFKFFVAEDCFPQTIDVIRGRAIPLEIELVVGDHTKVDFAEGGFFGALVQYPAGDGQVYDYTDFISAAHAENVMVTVAADLMALTQLKTPGEMGADVAVGTSQRFGVPMGFGGPHAAYFATKEAFKRQIPGRIIGASVDANGNKAYRMALQTREQHIRREKATSNICTAQVLLAVMAGMYAVYHGSEGLKNIGEGIHLKARAIEHGLKQLGFEQVNSAYYDTLKVAIADEAKLKGIAEAKGINFRYSGDGFVGIAMDERAEGKDLQDVLSIFAEYAGKDVPELALVESGISEGLKRQSTFLQEKVFNSYQAEHEMLRYLKRLENKDLSLAHSMIPLGSCTMKLNATTEMIPVTWEPFAKIHPFVPVDQTEGYRELIGRLEEWLCEVTGFSAISFQPNSGAQGELAGLLTIRAYHEKNSGGHRNIALIPSSAHGTNPASAVMAGMKVVVVACDAKGNIDVADLKAKAEQHKDDLSCLMVTYPSTHGVFEESIIEICDTIHQFGGQVYMDGANMNAQVGLTSPANIGADVCHLNLHKTFCIPHGGGGPGVGPIGVAAHLALFLPSNPVIPVGGEEAIASISAAPYGSANILLISYAYVAMMGGKGLTDATKFAILNANYLKANLEKNFGILYAGANGHCAHEFILDFRSFKEHGIEVEDIAKRLMDYGFHAPTVSFPVAGTLMVEPTESETMEELDRFIEALNSIAGEIQEVVSGEVSVENSVLKHAPHPMNTLTDDEWTKPYSRAKAAYPLDWVRERKFWPAVARIDNAYGDRNLICTCAPIEAFA